jgi:hypothetical protein
LIYAFIFREADALILSRQTQNHFCAAVFADSSYQHRYSPMRFLRDPVVRYSDYLDVVAAVFDPNRVIVLVEICCFA